MDGARNPGYIRYLPLKDRPVIEWPGGAHLALWFAPNLEFYEFLPDPNPFRDGWGRTGAPDVMSYAYRDYGNRVGFWRMLDVFDEFEATASVALNLAVLDHFPEIRDAMVQRDWEIFSHGIYNTRYLFGATEDEEREFYRDSIETLRRHTGKRLRGMLGPAFTTSAATPRLMAEAGLSYHVDWFIDDQPFPIVVDAGKLIGVPYTREINDGVLFNGWPYYSFEADYFAQIAKDQFDVLYREGAESGRVMCVVAASVLHWPARTNQVSGGSDGLHVFARRSVGDHCGTDRRSLHRALLRRRRLPAWQHGRPGVTGPATRVRI